LSLKQVQPTLYTPSHSNVYTLSELVPLHGLAIDLWTALCWTNRAVEHLQASEQQC